ncbi:MAG: response regulator [Anaerolineales bacterium]
MSKKSTRLPYVYMAWGCLAALMAPFAGMLIEASRIRLPLTFPSLLSTQLSQPLLWILDLAPLSIGLLAFLWGKQKQSSLQAAENLRQWQTMFDAFSDAAFLLEEASATILHCNAAGQKLLDSSAADPDGARLYALLANNRTTGPRTDPSAAEEFEWQGHIFDVCRYPIAAQNGRLHSLVILHDITAHKESEAKALQQKHYFETVVTNSPTAIVVLDNDGKIISINPAFERLFGYTQEEALGVRIDTLITTPDTASEAIAYTRQALDRPLRAIGKRRRKDGQLVDVEILAVPVYLEKQRLGALGIYHDITELNRARQLAEEASLAKSEFLANMSHEIRTPMNGVIGMLELVLDTPLTPLQADYVQTALQSAEALLSLLNDILDFSKIEAGRLELETINFNLRNLVEDVAYTLAKRAQDKGLEMACLVQPDLTSEFLGDPARLRQILVNLIGNAIKFTHQGEIVVRAEKVVETNSQTTVRFSVQDTGIGIPPDRQEAIFDRFTQADGSTARKYGGTGLGLAICKQLVEAMGGKIGVESSLGVGSTFWFEIAFPKAKSTKQDTAPLFRKPNRLTEARILIVDDNQTNRMILLKNVEALGCQAEAVNSGAKAIETLRTAYRSGNPYHVVLLDMQMPGMDGEQTARAIKSDPAIKNVKIIILTSMGTRGDLDRLETLGCAGYLLKPVKQQLLFDAIVAVLSETDQPRIVTRQTLSERRKTGQRILLAEDNPINQKLAVAILQRAGYLVDSVENGLQAFEKAQTRQYPLILMDVQMPEMDGFEATRKIRAWEAVNGGHIIIIAMTAHAMQGDRERCLQAGMDDYVSKPLQQKVLFSALDRWLANPDAAPQESAEIKQDYSTTASLSVTGEEGLFGEDAPLASDTRTAPPPNIEDEIASLPPVDLEAVLSLLNNDWKMMKEIFGEYRSHLSERWREIQDALNNGEAESLCRAAHNLKGISLNLCAQPLGRLAAQIEELGKQARLEEIRPLLTRLRQEMDRAEEFISTNILQEKSS